MANLDTRAKRESALGVVSSAPRVFPNPSGGVTTAAMRAHVGESYAFGAGAGGPGVPAGGGFLTLMLGYGGSD